MELWPWVPSSYLFTRAGALKPRVARAECMRFWRWRYLSARDSSWLVSYSILCVDCNGYTSVSVSMAGGLLTLVYLSWVSVECVDLTGNGAAMRKDCFHEGNFVKQDAENTITNAWAVPAEQGMYLHLQQPRCLVSCQHKIACHVFTHRSRSRVANTSD